MASSVATLPRVPPDRRGILRDLFARYARHSNTQGGITPSKQDSNVDESAASLAQAGYVDRNAVVQVRLEPERRRIAFPITIQRSLVKNVSSFVRLLLLFLCFSLSFRLQLCRDLAVSSEPETIADTALQRARNGGIDLEPLGGVGFGDFATVISLIAEASMPNESAAVSGLSVRDVIFLFVPSSSSVSLSFSLFVPLSLRLSLSLSL